MGLDNGIILKLKDKTLPQDFPGELDDYEKEHLSRTGELEVAYWRKCWGIRNEIVNMLHMKNDEGEHIIEHDDVKPIRRILISYMHPNYWEENADSIWEYDEMVENLIDQLIKLKWLEYYLREHKDAECYFYDSY